MPVPQAWNCTRCGAALPPIEPDEEFVACGFCKSTNAVVRERALAVSAPRRAATPTAVLVGAAAALVLVSLGVFLALGSKGSEGRPVTTRPADQVAITLANARVVQGQPVQARFAALPASGSSYWAALAPSGSSDATYGTWAWVDAGATSVALTAPAAGDYEFRLHSNYPSRSTNVIGRASFSVGAKGATGATKEITEGAVFQVGDRGTLRFEAPLAPRSSERHWVALVRAGTPDGEWGSWHYLEAGATSATLALNEAGMFEVRLHDGYPRLSHHVIVRRKLEVR